MVTLDTLALKVDGIAGDAAKSVRNLGDSLVYVAECARQIQNLNGVSRILGAINRAVNGFASFGKADSGLDAASRTVKKIQALRSELSKVSILGKPGTVETEAKGLKNRYFSSISQSEIRKTMVELRQRMANNSDDEKLVSDIQNFANRLTGSYAGKEGYEKFDMLKTAAGKYTLSANQMQELKYLGETISSANSILRGTGIRLSAGKGTMVSDWEQLTKNIPSLQNVEKEGDQIRALLDFARSARESIDEAKGRFDTDEARGNAFVDVFETLNRIPVEDTNQVVMSMGEVTAEIRDLADALGELKSVGDAAAVIGEVYAAVGNGMAVRSGKSGSGKSSTPSALISTELDNMGNRNIHPTYMGPGAGTGQDVFFNPATGQFEPFSSYNKPVERQYNPIPAVANDSVQKVEELIASGQSFADNLTKADVIGAKLASAYGKIGEELGKGSQADAGKLASLTGETERLKDALEKANAPAKSLRERFKEIGQHIGKSLKSSLLGQFFRVAKMRALRAAVRAIASSFKEGITNLYQWSKLNQGHFAESMDTASTKLLLMKNSLATALAPAIESLVPVLSRMVSWIREASNAVSQFLALLSGRDSWTMATEHIQEFGEAVGGQGGAGQAVKDLLADWDELNVIQSQSGGGGGSGFSPTDYQEMFEESFVFDQRIKDSVQWLRDNFDYVLDIAKEIGIAIGLWKLGGAISSMLGIFRDSHGYVTDIGARIKRGFVGTILLAVGLTTSADAGAGIAREGLTEQNLIEMIIGELSSVAGGALLGYAIGGPGGAAIGATVGLALSIIASVVGFELERQEMIKEFASEWAKINLFPVDELRINALNAKVTELKISHENLQRDIGEMLGALQVVEISPSTGAKEKLIEATKTVIASAQSELQTSDEFLTLYYEIKAQSGLATNEEVKRYFTIDSTVSADLNATFTELGKSLGESFIDAETGAIDEGKYETAKAIANQISEAYRLAAQARNESEAEMAFIDQLRAIRPEDIANALPGVVSEYQTGLADSLRQADEQYVIDAKYKYAMLKALDTEGKYADDLAALEQQIATVQAQLDADNYLKYVQQNMAGRTEELVGKYLDKQFGLNFYSPLGEIPNGMTDRQKILRNYLGNTFASDIMGASANGTNFTDADLQNFVDERLWKYAEKELGLSRGILEMGGLGLSTLYGDDLRDAITNYAKEALGSFVGYREANTGNGSGIGNFISDMWERFITNNTTAWSGFTRNLDVLAHTPQDDNEYESIRYFDPDDEDFSILDILEPGQSISVDTSGHDISTEDTAKENQKQTNLRLASLERRMDAMNGYLREIASKEFSVGLYPSPAWSTHNRNSGRLGEMVSGEMYVME